MKSEGKEEAQNSFIELIFVSFVASLIPHHSSTVTLLLSNLFGEVQLLHTQQLGKQSVKKM